MIQMETKNLYPSEHVEVRETRNASSHLEETVCPQDHPDASRRNNGKDPMKMATVHNGLCVIDMLSDDGENSSSRGNLEHENHVAFSVEGLGKVEMATPVHSPQHPARNFSYECHKPSKFPDGSHSSKNLNFSLVDQLRELDNMAFGVDVPTDTSSLKLPPYLEELCCNSKHKFMVHDDCLLHNAEDFLGNDEPYDSRVDKDRFKWHEKPSFLDHNFADNECGLSWKNWSSDLDSSMGDHMRSRNYENPDFSFEDFHMKKRRAGVKAANCFDFSGLSSPLKHQIEHGYDFISSDMTRYPTRHRNSDFSEMAHCSAWPTSTTEDSGNCLSFLSEDSCLSCAAWREGTKNPLFNYTRRKNLRGHEADFKRPVNKFTNKNTFNQELWQQESCICSGMRKRMPDFSSPGDDWLSGDRCNIDAIAGYASMNASETQKASFFGCKHWTDEPLNSEFNPPFYVDEKPSASRSEHDALSGNLFSDKVAFCQQVSPGHSSHILSNIKQEYGHQESFNGIFKNEKDSHRIQFQESVSTGENKSVTLPAISSTLHQSIHSSPENGTTMNVSDSENNESYSKEKKVKTPEMVPGPNAVLSPLRSEGGSSSVDMPQKLEEVDGLKEHANSMQTSLMNQNEHKEDSGHGKGDLKHGPLSNVDRSCKVMMLGRFVLQLL